MLNEKIDSEILKRIVEVVVSTLGPRFIQKIESEYAHETKTLHEKDVRDAQEHPFALWWRTINQEMPLFESTQKLSRNSLFFLRLATTLDNISDLKGRERILEDIRNPTKFYSAFYEAYIAAEYMFAGYKVEALQERTEEGAKTCDLRISIDGNPVFVECKSIDDISTVESKKWGQLSTYVNERLYKYHCCPV